MENSPENFQPKNRNNGDSVPQRPQRPLPPRKKKRKDIINNSGQGDVPVVKVVTDKFNWGAFFFTWIWGICYKKWITLIIIPCSFIPLVPLGLCIWFGIQGNKWAWQSKRYRSIQEFHEIHKKWAIAGLSLFIAGIVVTILAYASIFASMYAMMGKGGFMPTTDSSMSQQMMFDDSFYGGSYKSSRNTTYKKETKRTQPKRKTYNPNQTMTIDLTKPYTGN